MKYFISCLTCLLLSFPSLWALQIQDTLYLNSGQSMMADSSMQIGFAFNGTPIYSAHNKVLKASPGDSLQLTIFNSDSTDHAFVLEGHSSGNWNLPAGQFSSRSFATTSEGVFLFVEASASSKYRYLGAAGMLVVEGGHPAASYYWNIREFSSLWNDSLQANQSINWSAYDPDYFILNGRGKPQIVDDSSAVVRGGVGDTIRIYVINTGLGLHSLHFHGYHVRVVQASKHPRKTNWIKDTMPVATKESLTLELIPDKPGMYPVHDHNLISVSGGGYYPHGIFLVMDIN